jgi:hypothetical protein
MNTSATSPSSTSLSKASMSIRNPCRSIQNVQFQVKKSCPDLLLLAIGFVVLRETAPLVFQQVSFHLHNISALIDINHTCALFF